MIDIQAKLIHNRIIFINGKIDDEMAYEIISELLYLESIDPTKDISIYINSGGGSVSAGFAIYDTMNFIKCDVSTVCVGMAASMAGFLLTAGKKGKRFCLPNSTVMLHQPHSEADGQVTDILIQAHEVARIKNKMIKIVAKNCNQSEYYVEEVMDRDSFFNATQALDFGIIDKIL